MTTGPTFTAGWYQIVEANGDVVAGPFALSSNEKVQEFVAETQTQTPGGGGRQLQSSTSQDGPWALTASLS
jgi:hypothetical protein